MTALIVIGVPFGLALAGALLIGFVGPHLSDDYDAAHWPRWAR